MSYDPNPPPFEQDDAALAEQMQIIAEGRHPVIERIMVERDRVVTFLRDGTVKIKKVELPGRNDPCYCGSKVKFKKCCGR
jgi:uncharacterized protein YecA (UPF0149 family)